jgi:hypothetical protein
METKQLGTSTIRCGHCGEFPLFAGIALLFVLLAELRRGGSRLVFLFAVLTGHWLKCFIGFLRCWISSLRFWESALIAAKSR